MTETIIRSATTGMKQADTSLNSVLNNLFNPLTRKRVKELAMGEEEEGKYVARLSREVDGSGRENSIASGKYNIALPIPAFNKWVNHRVLRALRNTPAARCQLLKI